MRHDEKQKELHFFNGFQHWRTINHVHAKSFLIQGDHLLLNYIFKLHLFLGQRRLINNGVLANPDLTLDTLDR